MFAHVLIKLGLPADATEADAVAEIDRRDLAAASMKADLAHFVALSGKKSTAEARGVFEAWSGQGAELTSARADVERLETNNCNAEAKALIDAAQQARKVMPGNRAKSEAIYIKAQQAHGAKEGLETLKAHLDALVPVAPSTEVREQRVDSQSPAHVAGSQFDGKRYEQMTPGERHNLRASGELGERMYQELRTDWLKRDKPTKAA